MYARLKEIFWDRPEYVFGIDNQQVKEIHQLLDKTYEDFITEGPTSETIFIQARKDINLNIEPLSFRDIDEDQSKFQQPVFRYRPYNMESNDFNTITYNQQILDNIDDKIWHIEGLKEIIEANQKWTAVPIKRGRPKLNNYTIESDIPVNSLNDLVYILRGKSTQREPITTSGRIAIKKIPNTVKAK